MSDGRFLGANSINRELSARTDPFGQEGRRKQDSLEKHFEKHGFRFETQTSENNGRILATKRQFFLQQRGMDSVKGPRFVDVN